LVVRKALNQYHDEQQQIRQEKLEWRIKMRRKPVMVSVQIQTGRLITIAVSPDDNLEDIREKIKMKEGCNPDQQVLMFNGYKLIEGTVEELGITGTSTLFLTLRNLGG
jgi:hypothetical protein